MSETPDLAAEAPCVPVGIRLYAVVAAAVTGLTVSGFVAWAAVAPMPVAAIAGGLVVSEVSRVTVSHPTGGEVAEVLVHEGDMVMAGEVLLRLVDVESKTTLDRLSGRLDAARAREAALAADQSGAIEIVFPEDLLERSKSEAPLASLLKVEREIFAERLAMREGELDILDAKVGQLGQSTEILDARSRAISKEMQSLEEAVKRARAGATADGARSQESIGATEARIEALKAERSAAMADFLALRVQMSESEIRKLQILGSARTAVTAELGRVQEQILDLSSRVEAATAALHETRIKAPQAGRVVRVAVASPGVRIEPGQAVVDLLPSEDRFIVRARIAPDDRAAVRVGASAEVRFVDGPAIDAPSVAASVVSVSPVAHTDPRTGVGYYDARLTISESAIDALSGTAITPGAPVEVRVAGPDTSALGLLGRGVMERVSPQ